MTFTLKVVRLTMWQPPRYKVISVTFQRLRQLCWDGIEFTSAFGKTTWSSFRFRSLVKFFMYWKSVISYVILLLLLWYACAYHRVVRARSPPIHLRTHPMLSRNQHVIQYLNSFHLDCLAHWYPQLECFVACRYFLINKNNDKHK